MRVTDHHLNRLAGLINTCLGTPAVPFDTSKKQTTFMVGHHYIEHGYGGVQLARVENKAGAIADVFECGYTNRPDLYARLHAFIQGIEAGKQVPNESK